MPRPKPSRTGFAILPRDGGTGHVQRQERAKGNWPQMGMTSMQDPQLFLSPLGLFRPLSSRTVGFTHAEAIGNILVRIHNWCSGAHTENGGTPRKCVSMTRYMDSRYAVSAVGHIERPHETACTESAIGVKLRRYLEPLFRAVGRSDSRTKLTAVRPEDHGHLRTQRATYAVGVDCSLHVSIRKTTSGDGTCKSASASSSEAGF